MVKVVLCVGLVCLDVVSICKEYPKEDSDQRALSRYEKRGGNAANTSVVLANLNTRVEFIGLLPNTDSKFLLGAYAARYALEDLKKSNVEITNVVYSDKEDFPISMITVNKKNGSRTIIHHRGNLDELKYEDLEKLVLSRYSWIHFEGRKNTDDISKTLDLIAVYNKKNPDCYIMASIELEKPHVIGLMSLLCKVDLVFMSTEYAMHLGYELPLAAVEGVKSKLKTGGEIICTWGSVGAACGTNKDGDIAILVESESSAVVKDTIGAGDSFIAGVIKSRSNGRSLLESVEFGCRVAEKKISDFGFDHVKVPFLENTSKKQRMRNQSPESSKSRHLNKKE